MKQIYLPRSFYKAGAMHPAELSAKAAERLRQVELWLELRLRGMSSEDASRLLRIARSKLYRWHKRLEQHGPSGLEDGSRAPKRRRQPTWPGELAAAVLALRTQYPRWGKDKLVVLLRRDGWQVSTSMVGRILDQIARRGLMPAPPLRPVSARKRRPPRPHAIRKPKEYEVRQPGDLVEVDTLDLRPLPGLVLKQFTARDIVCRWDGIDVYSTASSRTAANFLDSVQSRYPFPIHAIQVDGGSEFMADFEAACAAKGIHLFVLPPRSPKLNGHVERAQRTHTEEFWECYDGDLDLASVRPALRDWEQTYNTIRPHQSLAWLTPAEYLAKCPLEAAPT